MNHYCPKGPKCVFRKQGKCKFVGSEFERCVLLSQALMSSSENMHDRQDDRYRDNSSNGTPSIAPGSPIIQPLSETPLSPLASPFAAPNSFRIPTYEGVDARPFSPPSFSQNFLGFQDYAPGTY